MGSMKDLLGDTPYAERYPDVPGHARGSATSKAAADSVRGTSAKVRERVFAFVCDQFGRGATCDETEIALQGTHQSISARIRELVLAGRIRDTGTTRKTRSGRSAAVYERMPT